MRRAVLLAALLAAATLSSVAPAQQSPATVTGLITDSGGVPLPGVEVTSSRPQRRAVTTPDGRFRLGGLEPGDQVLSFRRIGHRSLAIHVLLRAGETRDTVVALAVLPVPLDTIRTEAEALEENLRQAGFYDRQRMGLGDFLTRAAIERMAAIDVWAVLRRVPFVDVVDAGPGRRFVLMANGTCRPVLYVDGLRTPDLIGIPVEIIDGIEVYRRPTLVPVEYNAAGRACGAVLIWTR